MNDKTTTPPTVGAAKAAKPLPVAARPGVLSLTIKDKVDVRQAVYSALKRVTIPQDITHSILVPGSLPDVWGEEQQLVNVFVNLFQNAVDAMPSGGKLSVEARSVEAEGKPWVIVRVRDTGVGINEVDLKKIFERNYTTKETEKDLGFGLWWSQTYIERLGGRLFVESRLKEGTKFTIQLPIYESQKIKW